MIKLMDIYNEIKLISKITPEMVDELDKKLWSKGPLGLDDDLHDLYFDNGYNSFFICWNEWLYKQPEDILKNLYKGMLKLKAKHNV